MLGDAKRAFDRDVSQGHMDGEQVVAAQLQLAICEGSDWFWWFGDYNPADSVSDFESPVPAAPFQPLRIARIWNRRNIWRIPLRVVPVIRRWAVPCAMVRHTTNVTNGADNCMDVFANVAQVYCCTRRPCPATAGNGDLGPEAYRLSISWLTAVCASGRRCRWGRPTKICRPTSACRFMPVITA